MGSKTRRGLAAAATVVIASMVCVTTGALTQHWAVAWWVATGVLVVIGAGLQWWLTVTDSNEVFRSQQVDRTVVEGSLRQWIRRPGTQSVRRTKVTGDLTQKQGGDDGRGR